MEVLEAELVAAVPLAEPFEVVRGVVLGGGVHVDEISCRAPVSQGADLGADDVGKSEDQAVLRFHGRCPEVLFEDVHFAVLAGCGDRGHKACGERVHADDRDGPATLEQTVLYSVDDVRQGAGFSVATSRS